MCRICGSDVPPETQLTKGTVKTSDVPVSLEEGIVLGAKMLRLALAFDNYRMSGLSDEDAISRLRSRSTEFEPEIVNALADIKPEGARMELRKVLATKLTTGMVLQQEIRNRAGMLVVAKGQEITHALQVKLDNFSRAGTIDREIMALVPV